MRCAKALAVLLCVTAVTSCSDGLNPARDLTGTWIGTAPNGAFYTDNAANPNCAYEADVQITFAQDGSSLAGSFNLTVRSSEQLLGGTLQCVPIGASTSMAFFGGVSSSAVDFELIDGATSFSGTFTSDILTGDITSTAPSGIMGELTAIRQ
jgi:hypothetical protein